MCASHWSLTALEQDWHGISPKDRAIVFKKTPIVVKFVREADSRGRPFELHMSRCSKWGKGVDQAMRSSKSQLNPAGSTAAAAPAAAEPASEEGWGSSSPPWN